MVIVIVVSVFIPISQTLISIKGWSCSVEVFQNGSGVTTLDHSLLGGRGWWVMKSLQ